MNGYKPQTTFWMDFSIADRLGEAAVRDTFKRAFAEWHTDVVYLTELVMVLNHKIWQHYEAKNESLARLYDELWRGADAYAVNTLKGDDMAYFYDVTD